MGARAATKAGVSGHAGFAHELIALTKEAVAFHHKMSGDPVPTDEKFIRDWIAIKLFEAQGRQVMFEVTPANFRGEVLKNKMMSPQFFAGGRVDMIIFDKDCGDNASAIIELKRDAIDMAAVRNDVERISRLLSACGPAVAGYELLCVVVGGKTIADYLSPIGANLARSVRNLGEICGQIVSEEYEIQDADCPTWCGVYVVPVKPAVPTRR